MQLEDPPIPTAAGALTLRAVKRRYDPTNFFHHNLNVTPAEG